MPMETLSCMSGNARLLTDVSIAFREFIFGRLFIRAEVEDLARKLGIKLYRTCVKDNVLIEEGVCVRARATACFHLS